MKMNQIHPVVLQMKNLISEGIVAVNDAGSPFPQFHQDLIQYYFKSRKVEIDYGKELVKIEIPVGDDHFTKVNISCQPLEQFLCSCVKTDEKSLEHYRKLLRKFQNEEVA